MATEKISMDGIRAAAERLIREATLHKAGSTGEPDLPNLADDILLVGPAALAGLDMATDHTDCAALAEELAAAKEQRQHEHLRAERLWQTISNALVDFEHRDELSALDRLRYALKVEAALSTAEPSAEGAEG